MRRNVPDIHDQLHMRVHPSVRCTSFRVTSPSSRASLRHNKQTKTSTYTYHSYHHYQDLFEAMMPRNVVKIITGSRLRAFTDLCSTVVNVITVITVIDIVYGAAQPINHRLLRLLRSSTSMVGQTLLDIYGQRWGGFQNKDLQYCKTIWNLFFFLSRKSFGNAREPRQCETPTEVAKPIFVRCNAQRAGPF